MKIKIVSILFLTVYLAAMLRAVIPYVEYFANYDYIKEELCINKEKPYLKCNGSCYVESLLKSANLINDANSHKSIIPEVTLFFPIFTLTNFVFELPKVTFLKDVTNNYAKNNLIINKYINAIFKPPKMV